RRSRAPCRTSPRWERSRGMSWTTWPRWPIATRRRCAPGTSRGAGSTRWCAIPPISGWRGSPSDASASRPWRMARACSAVARRGPDGEWRLWGDKWFTSVANAEVALTLARPEGAPEGTRGLGMFLVPKRLPDGSKNAWTINRLKDKLGSRSMATGEVTYAGAIAYVVGDLGSGFKQMMEMVNGSRLSNA